MDFVSNNVLRRIQPQLYVEVQRLGIGLAEGGAEGIFRDAAVHFLQIHSSLLGKGDHIGQPDGRHRARTQQGDRLAGQGDVLHEFLEFEQRGPGHPRTPASLLPIG